MKKVTALLLVCLLLTGCGQKVVASVTDPTPEAPTQSPTVSSEAIDSSEYESRFSSETRITLSDNGITVDGGDETPSVYTSRDIVYYEDRDVYESGNPYGEGETWEKHTAQEADAHIVVNITTPGAYRLSGTLSAGQIRVDLGEDAEADPEAVVELILDGADITCTVAPAIVFRSVYECAGDASEDTASAQADTSAAGASLILTGENTVTGSHVARIYQDNDKEKKLIKQDGAIYSYMSMNVFGPGALLLTADNEGLDTEMHLTIQGGDITIRSGNDGINTNEDNVSVTTINGGSLHITAGLSGEGDGIDSNGYLVVNGGHVTALAHPASDSGLDSSCGTYVNGGTVIALGAAMDRADGASGQVTLNLQFAQDQSGSLAVEQEDGTVIFSYDPASEEDQRQYQGAILSCPELTQGETYHIYANGVLLGYSSTQGDRGFGGFHPGAGPEEQPPEGLDGQRPEKPKDREQPKDLPDGGHPDMSGGNPPMPDDFPKEGTDFQEAPHEAAVLSTEFTLTDRVGSFFGLAPAEE